MDRAGWDAPYRTTDLVWTANPNQFLVAEVAELTPGTALDLGAGEGRNAVWLAQRGWQVTAVDFSAVGLAKAAQLADAAGVTLTTVCADVGDYVPPAGGFDLVAVLYLPAAVRAGMHRRAADAVAAGGTLLVVGHDTTNLTSGHGGPQRPRSLVLTRRRGRRSRELRIGHRPGADRVHRSVETGDGERIGIDALVRAHRSEQR